MSRVLSTAFKEKLKLGATPTTYISITTQAGVRIYAKRTLNTQFAALSKLYGGGNSYGDSITYGQGTSVISREAFLKSHGNIGRSLQVTGQSRSKSGSAKRIQNLMFALTDGKKVLRRRFSLEPVLGKSISMRMGFSDIQDKDHLTLYSGTITRTTVTNTSISIDTIEA